LENNWNSGIFNGGCMGLKERFYKVYNNLPLGLRDDIVLVIKDDSVTWRVARLEVDNNTLLSQEILKKLADLQII